MLTKDKRILIVGLGLMGGSYAEALTAKGYDVGAVTRSKESIDYALSKGIISCGTISVTAEMIGGYDILVFALYPHIFLQWLTDYQQFIKPGALLTDVTGVKSSLVEQVQLILRPDLEFVGAHPMAGREVYGVKNSTAAIFAGANYIVTPTPSNTPDAIATVEDIGREIGCARISRLSPSEHDTMIGFLSQLTHCIAVALMTGKDVEHMSAYTGDSFRDLTRIARINDEMWSELFLINRDALLEQMDLFTGQMQILRDAIASGDTQTLRSMMRLSSERRALFDK